MKAYRRSFIALLVAGMTLTAHASDLSRATGIDIDVLRGIEHAGREGQAQTGAPVLEQWLIASRNTALAGGTSPIPPHIRQQLQGFGSFDNDLLNRVRFKVGDSGVANLANLGITYWHADAITLIDVIVFSDPQGVNDPGLWAHELQHVKQFRDWGVRDFAIRYLRDPIHERNPVEGEARQVAQAFQQWRQAQFQQPQPYPAPVYAQPPQYPRPYPAPPSYRPQYPQPYPAPVYYR